MVQTNSAGFTVRFSISGTHYLQTYVDVKEAHILQENEATDFKFKCLWDTGATCGAITSDLVKELNLKSIRNVLIQTAGHSVVVPVYLVNVYMYDDITFPGYNVVEFPYLDGNDVIIGMDIIGKGDFVISSYKEQTYMSFRYPSNGLISLHEGKEFIDFPPQKK